MAGEQEELLAFFATQVEQYDSQFHEQVSEVQTNGRLLIRTDDEALSATYLARMNAAEGEAKVIAGRRSQFIAEFAEFFETKFGRKLSDVIPLPGPLDLMVCAYFLPRTLLEDGPSYAIASLGFDLLPDVAQVVTFLLPTAIDTAALSAVAAARIAARMDAMKSEWRQTLAAQGGQALTSENVGRVIEDMVALVLYIEEKPEYDSKHRHIADLAAMIRDCALIEEELIQAGQ